MKRVLITGKASYIGESFENWLRKNAEGYQTDTIDLKDLSWREYDFSYYDAVFHVAGIAHRKEKKENKRLYYEVNRDLALETAKKAYKEGVKQFVYLSSMSVYGVETGIITDQTRMNPKTAYGRSKLQAEKLLKKLSDSQFKVVILRPPMVYGPGCKGNYPRLAKLIRLLPVFPDICNQRSMIYIDNLAAFVKSVIDSGDSGTFCPQNDTYASTSNLVRLIAEAHHKKVRFIKLLNPFIRLLDIHTVNSLFGSLVYDKSLSGDMKGYSLVSLEQSIVESEGV